MRVMNQPIEMIPYTDDKGYVRPIRFRLQFEDGPLQVIKVDKVISKQAEKLAGNPMILYKCQRMDGDDVRYFYLKYEINTCKWILFRMQKLLA